ncbi:MAG: site-specific integrase [Ramlibacter sp.]|nr:site-specific integrase [Ramlibacter sp.]
MRGRYASESFRTKAEASRWAVEQEGAIEDARVGKVPRKTLADAFVRYARDVTPSKRGWRPEGIRIEKFKATIPFVDKMLTDITSDDWGAWRDSLAAGSSTRKPLAPGSVIRDLNIIRAMHSLALTEWKWIKVNPLADVKSPPPPVGRKRLISATESAALCNAFGYAGGKPLTQSSRMATGMLFALETGMRAGEVFGLRKENVEFGARVAHLPLTKNGEARDVPLTRRAAELIELAAGADLVFGVGAASASSLFRKYRPAELADVHFHDTRHTAATRIASSGKLTPFELCRMFGWQDMNQALRYFNATASDIAAKLD